MKIIRPGIPPMFLTGRWESEHVEDLQFAVKNGRITGGGYRYRNRDVTGVITGGQIRGSCAEYGWREPGRAGRAVVERRPDGTLLQTSRWGDSEYKTVFRRAHLRPGKPPGTE